MPSVTFSQALENGFGAVADLIEGHAASQPEKNALVQGERVLTYANLSLQMDSMVSALRCAQVAPQSTVGVFAATTIDAIVAFLGTLRAGCVPALIPTSATDAQVYAMIADSGASCVLADADGAARISGCGIVVLQIDDHNNHFSIPDETFQPFAVAPDDSFNIIYSSGTTGRPKGIVQSHGMRWAQIVAYAAAGFADAVTMVATPLYSNTTLVSLLPTLGLGGTAIVLRKFDAREFLEMSERWRATHAMLVPIQYRRILAVTDFDKYDLSSFRVKTCTGAPFSTDLKREVLLRWPGMLLEFYGMTEGGGTSVLLANAFPHKLHTVGQPVPNCDIRVIDDGGRELPRGETGEIVGRSKAMMQGYHRRSEETEATNWYSPEGERFIRHGDIGRFDKDGFLILLGRAKDLIISGGFNIYPSDIEAVLREHPAVADAAVIGVPSETWGETPFAFYVSENRALEPKTLLDFVNARLGRTQQLSGLEPITELPRSPVGKVLKRDLRYLYEATISSRSIEEEATR